MAARARMIEMIIVMILKTNKKRDVANGIYHIRT